MHLLYVLSFRPWRCTASLIVHEMNTFFWWEELFWASLSGFRAFGLQRVSLVLLFFFSQWERNPPFFLLWWVFCRAPWSSPRTITFGEIWCFQGLGWNLRRKPRFISNREYLLVPFITPTSLHPNNFSRLHPNSPLVHLKLAMNPHILFQVYISKGTWSVIKYKSLIRTILATNKWVFIIKLIRHNGTVY